MPSRSFIHCGRCCTPDLVMPGMSLQGGWAGGGSRDGREGGHRQGRLAGQGHGMVKRSAAIGRAGAHLRPLQGTAGQEAGEETDRDCTFPPQTTTTTTNPANRRCLTRSHPLPALPGACSRCPAACGQHPQWLYRWRRQCVPSQCHLLQGTVCRLVHTSPSHPTTPPAAPSCVHPCWPRCAP